MPNRTIYLPDDLDDISRRAGLNLSQLTQKAIKQFVADHRDEVSDSQVDAASERVRELKLAWPPGGLAAQRSEAGER